MPWEHENISHEIGHEKLEKTDWWDLHFLAEKDGAGMPWDAKEFASKHNKKLKGAAASKAASMANAMLREGVPEGIAIATANKHGDRMLHAGKRANWHKGSK